MGGWEAGLLGKIRAKKRMSEWLAGSLSPPKVDLTWFRKKKRTGMRVNEWLGGLASWEDTSNEKDE